MSFYIYDFEVLCSKKFLNGLKYEPRGLHVIYDNVFFVSFSKE